MNLINSAEIKVKFAVVILQVETYSYNFRTSVMRRPTTCFQHGALRLQRSHTKVGNFYVILII